MKTRQRFLFIELRTISKARAEIKRGNNLFDKFKTRAPSGLVRR